MAHDPTSLHAFGGTFCVIGCYFITALGLWNMAGSGVARRVRATLIARRQTFRRASDNSREKPDFTSVLRPQ